MKKFLAILSALAVFAELVLVLIRKKENQDKVENEWRKIDRAKAIKAVTAGDLDAIRRLADKYRPGLQ